MRKILTILVIFLLPVSVVKLNAQCNLGLSGLTLTVNQNASGIINNQCVLNFNLSFNITYNNGNKYIYINLWNSSDYGDGFGEYKWTVSSAKMPKYNEMDGSGAGGHGPLAVIGIDNLLKQFMTTYSADPLNINTTNNKLITGTSITSTDINGRTFITVSGLQITLPQSSCVGSLALKGNIWSTQSKGGEPSIHCTDNEFDFTVGEIKVEAATTLNCTPTRNFSLYLDVASTNPLSIQYKGYYDADGNGILTYDNENKISDPVAYTSPGVQVSNTNPSGYDYSVVQRNFNYPYDGTHESYKYNSYFLVISYTNSLNTTTNIVKELANNCSVLPVHFQSFTAYRNPQRKEQVLLKWETASEQNNRGFYVQRKVNGQWKNIAFVFSQAENGNSSTTLAYEYKEVNTAAGVSQYQIQQVDMDGKTSYSDVKSVVGIEQKSSVVIYPNPAVDGKVNLVFNEHGNVKDVIVTDMNGRIVKQYSQLATNTLNIEGLQRGFYTIKITDRSTAITIAEKVIIK